MFNRCERHEKVQNINKLHKDSKFSFVASKKIAGNKFLWSKGPADQLYRFPAELPFWNYYICSFKGVILFHILQTRNSWQLNIYGDIPSLLWHILGNIFQTLHRHFQHDCECLWLSNDCPNFKCKEWRWRIQRETNKLKVKMTAWCAKWLFAQHEISLIDHE